MNSFNVFDMWTHMGALDKFVVLLLVGMSVYSVWVMIDRFLNLRKAGAATEKFLAQLRAAISGGDTNAALESARVHTASPVAKVVEGVIGEYQLGMTALTTVGPKDVGQFDVVDNVNREIERLREREIAQLKRGLGGLASISSAAPFIGLFGTVVGIINAFRSMADSGQGGLGAVSAGISEALFTTATGLIVAIPAVMAFNYFTGRIEEVVIDIYDVSSELLNHMLREGRSAS